MDSSALAPKHTRPLFFEDPRPCKRISTKPKPTSPIRVSPLRHCHEELINQIDKRSVKRLAEKQIHVKRFFSSATFPLPMLSEDERGLHPITKLYEEVFVSIEDVNHISGKIPGVTGHERFYNRDELVSSLRTRMSFYSAALERLDNQETYYHQSAVFPDYLQDRQFITLNELRDAFSLERCLYNALFNEELPFIKPNSVQWIFSNGQFHSKINLKRMYHQEIEKAFLLIRRIFQHRSDFYISQKQLPAEIPARLVTNATEYVQSSSLLLKNGVQLYRGILSYLNKRHADLSCYYIKDDPDGYAEIKAKRVIQALTHGNRRYNQLFQQKFLADFSHAEMTRPLNRCVVSREVRNRVEVDRFLIENQSNAYFYYCNATYRQKTSLIKTYESELKQLNAKLSAIGRFSVPFHILMDLLFFSCDSHQEQYITNQNSKGEIDYVNIDFSRVLSNFIAITLNKDTFCPFRSVFLFHPRAFEPMPEELIKLIESWNIDQIIAELTPLLGNPQEFSEELNRYWASHTTDPDKIQHAKDRIGEICFSRLHIKSLEQLVKRLRDTKTFVEKCKSHKKVPTLYGLFELLYADLAVILNIFKRMTPDPAQRLNWIIDENGIRARTLKSIVQWVKEKKMATIEEIAALEQAVANLEKEASDYRNFIQFFSII